jgi:hypothetical protein
MKKYFMLALATMMLVGVTIAQQPGHQRGPRDGKGPGREQVRKEMKAEMTPQKMVDHIAKQLELTDAQKADLLKHFEKQAAKREEMKQEFLKLKEMAEKERLAAQGEVEKIIGPDNFKKLQAKKIEQLQKMNKHLMMRKHRQMQTPPPPPACEKKCEKKCEEKK